MPEPARRRTLYLIDGHAQFYRAYHAIRTSMTSPVTQEPTNLTYGFVGMLLKVLRDYRPDYLVVAIDVSGDRESFRSALYPEYKANREAPPDDFGPQVDRCLDLLGQMRVPVVGVAGVEADDVIATLVRRLRQEDPDLDIRIVSRDKDLAQLLDAGVELFDVHQDRGVTPEDVFKTEGVRPEHVIDILALMGDNVDNIPGVVGVGPKTAAKLILQYGSIENLLAHLDEIKGKRRENIEAARDRLPLNRELVTLRDDVEVPFTLEAAACDVVAVAQEALLAAFRELGFNQHAETLRGLAAGAGAGAGAAGAAAPASAATAVADAVLDGGLFAGLGDGETGATPVPRGDYETITTVDDLDTLVARIRSAGRCAIATVADARTPSRVELCGVACAVTPGAGVYVAVRGPEGATVLPAEVVRERLGAMIANASVATVGHDLKDDLNALRGFGVTVAEPTFDTMVASYVIDATRSGHGLDVLALALLGVTRTPPPTLLGRGREPRTFADVPLAELTPWAAQGADLALRLHDTFVPQLAATGLARLFHDLEMPLVRVLGELEHNGIRVDPEELERQRRRLETRCTARRAEIEAAAPHPFNPDSPKQLAVALFGPPDDDPPGLGLKVLKRGKTGPSTDVEVLEKLAADPDVATPVPELLIEYRKLTKLVNTYLVALADDIDPATGRVHASFNQTVAATGRLSSSDPNLQNIPIRTEVGREIRRAFVAEPGCLLVTADYSQIELRLLAHLAQDEALLEAFRTGLDIHTAVAAEVYGVEPEAVTSEQRTSAKMVNFGIVYGITAFGLARRLGPGVSREEAARIIAGYKERFRAIDAFLAECVASAEANGYVETILGRRRQIPQIRARHPSHRALGQRMAINTVVQGSAADLIKLAMVDLYRRLPEAFPDARMLLQIHDELVFETPEAQAEGVQAFVVDRMQRAMTLDVPLVVDAARSTSWIDAK